MVQYVTKTKQYPKELSEALEKIAALIKVIHEETSDGWSIDDISPIMAAAIGAVAEISDVSLIIEEYNTDRNACFEAGASFFIDVLDGLGVS